jgi:calcium binding protein
MTKRSFGARAIHDLPRLRSQEKRGAELFVDCYGDAEAEGSVHVYLSDALDYPFKAEWRGSEQAQRITILALAADWKSSRGLMFKALVNGRRRTIRVDEVNSLKPTGRVATVLDDYRAWWPYPLDEEYSEDDEDGEG